MEETIGEIGIVSPPVCGRYFAIKKEPENVGLEKVLEVTEVRVFTRYC